MNDLEEHPLVLQFAALLGRWGIDEGRRRFLQSEGPGGEPLAEAVVGEGGIDKVPPALSPWALAHRAHRATRERSFAKAHRLLDESLAARAAAISSDAPFLEGVIRHFEGTLLFHEGHDARALASLHRSLGLLGKDHYVTPRVLDTMGMVYSHTFNFLSAREFFSQSLALKAAQEPPDLAGVALTHGQLGRLFFDWGFTDEAHRHFSEDLKISREIHDDRGAAQMCNSLARIAMARGDFDEAALLIDECLSICLTSGLRYNEFFALKDCSLLASARGEAERAQELCARAGALLEEMDFPEGLGHLFFARGIAARSRGRFEESEMMLRKAKDVFDDVSEHVEGVRARIEIARTAQEMDPQKGAAEFIEALRMAERCRKEHFVREIEAELALLDESLVPLHSLRRARGRGVKDDTVALLSGTLETVTILFLDIKGFTDFSRTKDPETVFMVLNQIFYDMARVLEKYGITVNQYLGDGFMAIVRGEEHAARAVTAALELMEAAESFNGPRIVLELPILKVRAGLNSGPVYLGNVGTYNKVDFTAVGTTTNMAARLQNEGEPGVPCISASTYEEVRGRFRFKDGNPRNVFLKGLGDHPVWDVCEGLPGGSEMVEGDLQTGLADSPDSE